MSQEVTRIDSTCQRLSPQTAARYRPGGRRPRCLREKPRRLDDFGECDAGRNAESFEEVEQVLGREVARGARRVRTAAETAGRGVVSRDAALETRVDVRERRAARVVEVQRQNARA